MKKLLCILIGFMFCFCVFAQAALNPSHPIYQDIVAWETLGIVRNLPKMRPYPLYIIEDILQKVAESDYPVQVERANEYYKEIFSKSLYIEIGAKDEYKNSSDDTLTANKWTALGGVSGDAKLTDLFSVSYDLGAILTNGLKKNVLPMYQYIDSNASRDAVVVGDYQAYVDMDSSLSFGTDKMYFQAGIGRNSYGSFYNKSVVLSQQAYHAGNITFSYFASDFWRYTQSFLMIGATDNFGSSYSINPNKFLALHSVEFFPTNWLSISYYENIIYGKRFDLIYFLPAPYMICQSIGEYDEDNLQMGIAFDIKPFSGFVWSFDCFVDDFSMNEIVKLDFDTKIKIAGQTGVYYSPKNSFVSLVSADYTMVVPYMYTHEQTYTDITNGSTYLLGSSGINYQNYTNNGIPMGSNLPPNSDRVCLQAIMNPVKKLSVSVFANFIRHANINESIPVSDAINYLNAPVGTYLTDGSIYNYANAGYGYFTYAQENFMFMDQETKMYLVQLGFDASYVLGFNKWGSLSFDLGYTFEYIKNYGVQNQIYSGGYTDATEADVISAKNTWKSQLKDLINNYLSIKLVYKF